MMTEMQPTETNYDVDAWGMTRTTREELRLEDKDAWKHVVGLLLTIVAIGLVLAVLTVWLSGLLG
jgi:hypothetical protein